MAAVSQMQFKQTNSLSSDGFEISGEVQVIPFTLCNQIAKTDRLLLKVSRVKLCIPQAHTLGALKTCYTPVKLAVHLLKWLIVTQAERDYR